MPTDQPALDKLLREAKEARLKHVALVSRGEAALDHARAVARAIQNRVRGVTAPERQRPGAPRSIASSPRGT